MFKKTILFFSIMAVYSYAQTTVNPDISLIGAFNAYINNVKDTPEYGKLNLETPGFEMLVEGYLNPYARAVATLAYEEEEFAAEELYAEVLRGLPLELQVKAGKYLLGFGKLNGQHPHMWNFLHRPLSHRVFLGEEGFNDVGVDLNYMLPFGDIFSSITLGLFRGDAIANTLVSEETDLTGSRGISPIWIGHWGNFISLSDFASLEIGLSGSSGLYARTLINDTGDTTVSGENRKLNYLYGGLDLKYKYVPNMYTALTIQGEGILNLRDVPRDGSSGVHTAKQMIASISTFGFFISVDYRFLRQFTLGTMYDFTYGIPDDEPSFYSLANDDQSNTQGIYLWFGYYPVEETIALRMELEHLRFSDQNGVSRDPETKLTLQLLFSLGPHKAHPF